MPTLRKLYAKYIKIQFESNNIILLLPLYETTDTVRQVLSEHRNGVINPDVRRYEKEGSLVIIDFKKAYFGSGVVNFASSVGMIIEHAT